MARNWLVLHSTLDTTFRYSIGALSDVIVIVAVGHELLRCQMLVVLSVHGSIECMWCGIGQRTGHTPRQPHSEKTKHGKLPSGNSQHGRVVMATFNRERVEHALNELLVRIVPEYPDEDEEAANERYDVAYEHAFRELTTAGELPIVADINHVASQIDRRCELLFFAFRTPTLTNNVKYYPMWAARKRVPASTTFCPVWCRSRCSTKNGACSTSSTNCPTYNKHPKFQIVGVACANSQPPQSIMPRTAGPGPRPVLQHFGMHLHGPVSPKCRPTTNY